MHTIPARLIRSAQIYSTTGNLDKKDIPLGTVFLSKVVAVTSPGGYQATVYATNVNGNGPESERSNTVTVGERTEACSLFPPSLAATWRLQIAHILLRCALQAAGTLWWCRTRKAPKTKSS